MSQMFIDRQLNGFPALLDWLFLAGAIIAIIWAVHAFQNRKNSVSLKKYKELEEDNAELRKAVGENVYKTTPPNNRAAINMLGTNKLNKDAAFDILKKDQLFLADITRKGSTNFDEYAPYLLTFSTQAWAPYEIQNGKRKIAEQKCETLKQENDRLINVNASLSDSNGKLNDVNFGLVEALRKAMVKFQNLKGADPLVAELNQALGINKGVLQEQASRKAVSKETAPAEVPENAA